MRQTSTTTRLVLAALAISGALAGAIWFQTHPPDLDLAADRGTASGAKTQADAPPNLPSKQWEPDENGLSGATASLQTAHGTVRIKFFTKDAPATSRRIMQLIQNGFYDGQIFFRVIPGFAIQTGDPTGTGNGGSGTPLDAEPGPRRHLEGSVGLAHGADPDSGDSQFYITLSPQPQLDGQYTVFGTVTEGIEAVRKIQRGDRIIKLSLE